MKAWVVSDKNGDYGCRIVFAETRGKAHAYALKWLDDFDCCEWSDLRVRRFMEWDSHYKGIQETDWNEDRLELVRDFGWHCFEYLEEWCKDCEAKQYCIYHQDVEEQTGDQE